MKRVALNTVAVLVTATSAAALSKPGWGILRLDKDGDGLVSRAEFQPPEARHGRSPMAEADTDGDGLVSRSEMEAAVDALLEERGQEMRVRWTERFDSMDANGDDFVTPEEATDYLFNRVDANGDGFITEEEARAMRRDRSGRRGRGRPDERPEPWGELRSNG